MANDLTKEEVSYYYDYLNNYQKKLIQKSSSQTNDINFVKTDYTKKFLDDGGFTKIYRKERIENISNKILKWVSLPLSIISISFTIYNGCKGGVKIENVDHRVDSIKYEIGSLNENINELRKHNTNNNTDSNKTKH